MLAAAADANIASGELPARTKVGNVPKFDDPYEPIIVVTPSASSHLDSNTAPRQRAHHMIFNPLIADTKMLGDFAISHVS
jgi:hypothetical protein